MLPEHEAEVRAIVARVFRLARVRPRQREELEEELLALYRAGAEHQGRNIAVGALVDYARLQQPTGEE